jgi:hypothetical protein
MIQAWNLATMNEIGMEFSDTLKRQAWNLATMNESYMEFSGCE